MVSLATLLPPGKIQILDSNGAPLVDGTITYTIPNTDTLKNTWQNSGKTILNTNPVVLDSLGTATIYGDGQYSMTIEDVDGNVLYNALTTFTNTASTYLNVVNDFGAVGDGVTDDTAAIQDGLDYIASTGGRLYFPTGKYRITSALSVTFTYTSNNDITRPSIIGDGSGNSQILWDGSNTPSTFMMTIQRTETVDGVGLHAHSIIEAIGFLPINSGKNGYVSGLRLNKWAYIHCRDLWFHRLNYTLWIDQVVSSKFDTVNCRLSNYGIYSIGAPTSALSGDVYANNANTFINCENGGNFLGGFTSTDGSFTYTGGAIEGNGTLGTGGSGYGAKISNSDAGSPIACNFVGVYFEANGTTGDAGSNSTTADAWIIHSGTLDNNAYNFISCNFNRVAASYAPYGIFINKTTTTAALINTNGCVFTNYAGYSASANRKYIKITDTSGSAISVGVQAINNYYNQAVEIPDFIAGTTYYAGTAPGFLVKKSFTSLAYKTATQSIPTSSATALIFDTTSINDASMWSAGSPTRFTIPAGVTRVRLAGNVRFDTNPTADVNFQLFIRKNGASFPGAPYQNSINHSATYNDTLNCSSGILVVSPGDYFELFVQQNSVGSLNTSNDVSGTTWFSIEIIE